MVKVFPAGIFSVNAQVDAGLMIVPLETMRELLGYDDEVSAIEIRIDGKYGERESGKFRTNSRNSWGLIIWSATGSSRTPRYIR